MPVQSLEPLREGIAAQVSVPNRWLWTWGGVCFGYRQEEWLFTYDGIRVGRFVGDEIYDTNGDYLGELRNTGQEERLATSNYKKRRAVAAFSPRVESGHERPANRLPQTLYCGYRDFPSPEIFKTVESRGALHSRSEIISTVNTKKEATQGAQSKDKAGQAIATLHHPISVEADALAKLFSTAKTNNDTRELANAASSESNSTLAVSHLVQPIITARKSGEEAAPSQADRRAERLRLVLLNIKSRHAKT